MKNIVKVDKEELEQGKYEGAQMVDRVEWRNMRTGFGKCEY